MADEIKALTWDFGGVLLRTESHEPRRKWEQRLGLGSGELHDIVFDGTASRQATVGEASTADIWISVAEQLDLDVENMAEFRSDFWAGDQLDHSLIDATRSIRGYLKTALLSNAWPDLRSYLKHELQVADAFDLLVISAEEGTAKPDEEIYRILLERLEVSPHECIFIDDNLENIEAARQLGIRGILFQTRDQALSELRELLPSDLSHGFDV